MNNPPPGFPPLRPPGIVNNNSNMNMGGFQGNEMKMNPQAGQMGQGIRPGIRGSLPPQQPGQGFSHPNRPYPYPNPTHNLHHNPNNPNRPSSLHGPMLHHGHGRHGPHGYGTEVNTYHRVITKPHNPNNPPIGYGYIPNNPNNYHLLQHHSELSLSTEPETTSHQGEARGNPNDPNNHPVLSLNNPSRCP